MERTMENPKSKAKAELLERSSSHTTWQTAEKGQGLRQLLRGIRWQAHLLAILYTIYLGTSQLQPARPAWTNEVHHAENGPWRAVDQGRDWNPGGHTGGEPQRRTKRPQQKEEISEQIEKHQGKTPRERQPLQPVPGDPTSFGQEREREVPRRAAAPANSTATVGIPRGPGHGGRGISRNTTWRKEGCFPPAGGTNAHGRSPGMECSTEPFTDAGTDAAVHGLPDEFEPDWRSLAICYATGATNAGNVRSNTEIGSITRTSPCSPPEFAKPTSTQRCEEEYAEAKRNSESSRATGDKNCREATSSQARQTYAARAGGHRGLGGRGQLDRRRLALALRAGPALLWNNLHQPRPPDTDMMAYRMQACEKGDTLWSHEAWEKGDNLHRIGTMPPVSRTRTLAIEEDLMMTFRQTMNHQENDPPNPGRFGLPTEEDRDDGIPRVNGQSSHNVGDCVNLKLWRPARPGRELQLLPISHLIHFEADEHTPKEIIVEEEAIRTWTDLALVNWIHLKIHPTWTSATTLELGQGYQHMVIIDGGQFPPFTNWRGGMLNVELSGLEAGVLELDTGPTTTRVPLSYTDLMIQLNIPLEQFQVDVFINGIQLLESTPPVAFGHGFYMEVKIKPTEESSQGSEILRQLLRTPLHRQHEPAESESMTEDDLENDESESAYDVSQGSPHGSPRSSHQDADFRSGVHSPQQVTTLHCTKPVQIQLQKLVHSHDFSAQPGSPSPKNDKVDRLHFKKHRISLDLLLPVGTAASPIDQPDPELCAELLQPWPLRPQAGLPDDQPFVKVTTDWLELHPYEMKFLDYLHIFTDGSAKIHDDVAAWAIVLTSGASPSTEPDELVYHGWFTGKVVVNHDHPQYIGSHKADSTNSESTALFWAHLFALSCHQTIKGVIFHFDALVVGRAMDCSFNISEAYPIESNLRALMQATENIYTPQNVFAQHVKGHKGHPLNELANTLAFAATGQDLWEGDLPSCRRLMQDNAYQLKWLWISARRTADARCMPPSHQGKMMILPRTQLKNFQGTLPWAPSPLQSPQSSATLWPSCNILSFNVRTLKDPDSASEHTEGVIGRQILLETQLDDLDFALAGLQETRAFTSDTSATARYYKYRAAADHGHGGVELWVHKHKPIFLHEQKQIYFNADQAIVIHAAKDLLMIRWTPIPGCPVFLWVGHAPHKGHDAQTREAWWQLCHLLLQDQQPGGTIIGFLDANAAVGSHTCEAIGDFAADEEDHAGELFRELLQHHGLCLPSTFEGIHRGPSQTWFSSAAKAAKGLRNDFIVIPQEWKQHSLTSSVLPDIEVAQKNVDHLAIMLEAKPTMGPPRHRSQRQAKSRHVDWKAVRACRDQEQWRKIFGEIQQPPWEWDLHSHWHHCLTALTEQLAKTFPAKRSAPKKPFITDQVWALRNKQKAMRRQHLWRAHLCPQLDTLVAISVWKGRTDFRKAFLNGILWILRCHIRHAQDKDHYKKIQAELRQALRHQRQNFLETVAEEADQAHPSEIYAALRKAGFSSTRKNKFRPLPMVLTDQGEPAKDVEQLRKTWRDYFASIECGHEVQPEELHQLCNYTAIVNFKMPDPAFLQGLPTLLDFERALRRCNPGKAAGPDRLVPELGRYAARWMSHMLSPLFLKTSLYLEEPIHFKGGTLFEVFKGRGPTNEVTSYRGILVSSHVAKAFHNTYRRPTLDYHLKTADPLQYGGTPGRGVDAASHVLRLFFKACQLRKESCAIFFLDIKSAYYRLLRKLAIGQTCSYNQGLRLLQTLGLPEDAQYWLVRALHEPNALEAAGCPTWLRSIGANFHSCTWYQVRGDTTTISTLRGTRPGDGYADLLFNVVLSKVLYDIEEELTTAGLDVTLTWNGTKSFAVQATGQHTTKALNIVWADDVAVLIRHGQAAQLAQAVPMVIATYIDRLATRGLLLNFGAGKSEVMMMLRGPGSVAIRRSMFAPQEPTLEVDTHFMGKFNVRLVQKYKHLGMTLHGNGHMTTELKLRIAQAHSAFNRFRANVYQNKKLQLTKRTAIFRSCVLTVLLWNAGTWPTLRPCEFRYLSGAFLRLLRRLLIPDFKTEETYGWNETRLCATLRILPLLDQIRLQKVGYYGRLLRNGTDPHWALLAAEGQWIATIKDDLAWFHSNTQSQVFRPVPTDPEGHGYWAQLIREHHGTWKGLLKKAHKHLLLQQDVRHGRAGFYAYLRNRFIEADFLTESDFTTREEPPGLHICMPCGATFQSRTAWATHSFRAHSRRARERYVVDQETCGHCHHVFLNPYRLYLHLRNSPCCFSALRTRGIFVDPLPSRGSAIWNMQEQYTQCPYLTAEGPILPIDQVPRTMPPTLSGHEADLLFDLMELENVETLDPTADDYLDGLWTLIAAKVKRHPVSLEEVRDTLATWRSFIAQESGQSRRLRRHVDCQLLRAINTAIERTTYEWLCPDLLDKTIKKKDFLHPETFLQQIPNEHWNSCTPPTSGPLLVQPIFLHLFSGRRRSGDIQHILEQMTWPDSTWTPRVLSLDIVLDPLWGDARNSSTQEFWLLQSRRGAIAGVLAGPPCETFSVSRERWHQEHCGPRPLRSLQDLWGFSSLTIGEVVQLLASNDLFCFAARLCLEQYLQGKWATFEHPARPNRDSHPQAPSVWDILGMQILQMLPEVQTPLIMQGYLGAKSPKPTFLWHCHSPPAYPLVENFYTTKRLPRPLRMGREGKMWRTAPLKEYPEALNKYLGTSFRTWLEKVTVNPDIQDFTAEQEMVFNRMFSTLGDGELGPDFARPN